MTEPSPAGNRAFGRTGVREADLILEAARGLRRTWGDGLAAHDLSPHESRALRVVVRSCGGDGSAPRLADIATALRIAPRSATEVVDRLVARGLVERRPSAGDRRAVEVVPTPTGLEEHTAVERSWGEAAVRFLEPLDDGERAALASLLLRLVRDER
ncbi:MarR family transcriptional regulator [Serinibacter arcticus]|uniref:MarR family transcriptional regulator n=1 Tax=Serinibacter arcticus TaxID=1655435 RepID=A0A2U1ZVG6_9MICO|nr:MarR family winged helix-turn-helix transcriptional regulator [Serinibacter arcticus]PWD50985.1 MarR family transcriptional regulator [Serinibacter arcticus]